MSIHARTWGPHLDKDRHGDVIHSECRTCQITLTGDSIKEFKEILARGLNTAPPEKYPEWLKLADKISDSPPIQSTINS